VIARGTINGAATAALSGRSIGLGSLGRVGVGAIVSAVGNVGVGVIKASRAMNNFGQEFGVAIEEVSARVLVSCKSCKYEAVQADALADSADSRLVLSRDALKGQLYTMLDKQREGIVKEYVNNKVFDKGLLVPKVRRFRIYFFCCDLFAT